MLLEAYLAPLDGRVASWDRFGACGGGLAKLAHPSSRNNGRSCKRRARTKAVLRSSADHGIVRRSHRVSRCRIPSLPLSLASPSTFFSREIVRLRGAPFLEHAQTRRLPSRWPSDLTTRHLARSPVRTLGVWLLHMIWHRRCSFQKSKNIIPGAYWMENHLQSALRPHGTSRPAGRSLDRNRSAVSITTREAVTMTRVRCCSGRARVENTN